MDHPFGASQFRDRAFPSQVLWVRAFWTASSHKAPYRPAAFLVWWIWPMWSSLLLLLPLVLDSFWIPRSELISLQKPWLFWKKQAIGVVLFQIARMPLLSLCPWMPWFAFAVLAILHLWLLKNVPVLRCIPQCEPLGCLWIGIGSERSGKFHWPRDMLWSYLRLSWNSMMLRRTWGMEEGHLAWSSQSCSPLVKDPFEKGRHRVPTWQLRTRMPLVSRSSGLLLAFDLTFIFKV